MARTKAIEVFKRDNLLLEFIKAHKGKANFVTSKEVGKFLAENGYKVLNVGTVITKIMYERNAPICFLNSKGYYWATSREEIEITIADMKSRIASLNEHIEHLNNFIIR